MTKQQLQQVLELHAEWLESGGEDGKQADLSGGQNCMKLPRTYA